ncbi:MAG: hypothetical protein ACYDGR_02555, partial [Candidatus Dormibacteria bacterium]
DRKSVIFLVANPPDHPGMVALRMVAAQPNAANPPVEAWVGDPTGGSGKAEVTWLPGNLALFHVPYSFAGGDPSSRIVGVVAFAPKPALVEAAPEGQYIASLRATWPETRDIGIEPTLPGLEDRVPGPDGAVAGRDQMVVRGLFGTHSLSRIRLGREGAAASRVLCASQLNLRPVRFSPDGHELAVASGGVTYVLGTGGGRSLNRVFRASLLDWAE